MLVGRGRDGLKVLHEVQIGHLTQRAAGQQLGITDRWVRNLLARVEKERDGRIVHRRRGRDSNRRLSDKVRAKIVHLVKAKYDDFRPTLASESLAKDDGVVMSEGGPAAVSDLCRAAAGTVLAGWKRCTGEITPAC